MKAALFFELYGENFRATIKEYQKNPKNINMNPRLLYMAMSKTPPSYWVAEITGEDKKYGYSRNFIKGRKDYKYSNSMGSRGVLIEYILESGRIYEVKKPVSWQNSERYFCVVNNDGDIVSLEEREVRKCLKLY